jgi:hypothetical protein
MFWMISAMSAIEEERKKGDLISEKEIHELIC